MKQLSYLCMAAAFLAFGCGKSNNPPVVPPPSEPKVRINAPGVDISVDGKGGGPGNVKVNAPGVNVDVQRR